MDTLSILSYGGIAILIGLLVVFEVKYRKGGNNNGYVYYTYNNVVVRIRHLFSSQYRVYVYNNCPVQTRKDRYGNYFSLNGRSAADIEYQIDELYRSN